MDFWSLLQIIIWLILIALLSLQYLKKPETTTIHSTSTPTSLNTVNLSSNDYKAPVNLIVKQNEQKHFDVNKTGYTKREKEMLFYSVKNNKLDKIKNILLRHLPIDFQNEEGKTLLHVAAEYNHIEIVELLLDHNIDLKIEDNNKNTPFDIALDKNYEQIVEILVENGVDVNEIIKLEHTTTTRLHQAALRDRDDIIKLLHKNGADLNIIDREKNLTNTALYESVEAYKVKAAETLIRLGADISITDERGATILHIAARDKIFSIVKLLVEKGTDVNAIADVQMYHPVGTGFFSFPKVCSALECARPDNDIVNYLISMGAKQE